MKRDTHPEVFQRKAVCSCGNEIQIATTLSEDLHLDVCSACHSFYTGEQKLMDTGGRIDRFRNRFGGSLLDS